MAGSVTFAGVGSGIDIESLVSGLTAVAAQPISMEKSKAASLRAAQSTISNVGSLLSKLKLSVDALGTAQNASSFKASTTGTALAVSATGAAQPGSYDVSVTKLAKEQRTYSNAFSANALGLSGNLDLGVGSTSAQIAVTSTDTLNTIADKINGAGLRVGASVFYDGTNYRLQVRGLDTGAANAVTFGAAAGIGDQLGLRTAANTKQSAQDAALTIDGFAVTSATNQVSGAIPGVTLALKEEGGTTPSKVTVEADPTALGDKLQAVVDAYNSVIKSIQSAAGTSKAPAGNPALAGNSTLRGIAGKLSSTLLTTVGSGKYNLLGSAGVNLQNDGTLLLNRTKLATALQEDRAGVTALLGGNGTTGGIMSKISSAIEDVMDPTKGALETVKTGFDTRAKSVEEGVTRAQQRLEVYSENLRKQFNAMDSQVSRYQSTLSSLSIKA